MRERSRQFWLTSPTLLSLLPHLTRPPHQVGRAGRDGSEASCWLVLDDADQQRLRSLSYSNAVERHSVEAFLRAVGHKACGEWGTVGWRAGEDVSIDGWHFASAGTKEVVNSICNIRHLQHLCISPLVFCPGFLPSGRSGSGTYLEGRQEATAGGGRQPCVALPGFAKVIVGSLAQDIVWIWM